MECAGTNTGFRTAGRAAHRPSTWPRRARESRRTRHCRSRYRRPCRGLNYRRRIRRCQRPTSHQERECRDRYFAEGPDADDGDVSDAHDPRDQAYQPEVRRGTARCSEPTGPDPPVARPRPQASYGEDPCAGRGHASDDPGRELDARPYAHDMGPLPHGPPEKVGHARRPGRLPRLGRVGIDINSSSHFSL